MELVLDDDSHVLNDRVYGRDWIMSQQIIINSGPTPDSAKIGADKINSNFTELYARGNNLISQILLAVNCSAGDPITSQGYIANSTNPSRDFARVAGIALASGLAGNMVSVVLSGDVQNSAWNWMRGAAVFLSGTGFASSPPGAGFLCQFGQAKTADTIVMELEQVLY